MKRAGLIGAALALCGFSPVVSHDGRHDTEHVRAQRRRELTAIREARLADLERRAREKQEREAPIIAAAAARRARRQAKRVAVMTKAER